MEKEVLSFSVVTYHNSVEEIERLFNSIKSCTLRHTLTLVDNGNDTAMQQLTQKYEYHYINSGGNVGFGAAHNLALRQNLGKFQYHVIINPDVYFEDGTFEAVVRFMSKSPEVGAVVPKVLYPDGRTQHLCKMVPTPFDLFARRFLPQPLKNSFKERMKDYEFLNYNYDQNLHVPILSGCCLTIRDEALQKAGLFDERFFLYLEDVDLSRRIHQHYDTLHLAETFIYHDYRKASYKNINNLKLHLRSAVKYFNKWGWLADSERKRMNAEARKRNHHAKLNSDAAQ